MEKTAGELKSELQKAAGEMKSELQSLVQSIVDEDDFSLDDTHRAIQILRSLKGLKLTSSEKGVSVDEDHLPPGFRCPISGDLPNDPVIVASGQVFLESAGKLKSESQSIVDEDDFAFEHTDRAIQVLRSLKGLKLKSSEKGVSVDEDHLPPGFRCPISGDLPNDPVIVASGQIDGIKEHLSTLNLRHEADSEKIDGIKQAVEGLEKMDDIQKALERVEERQRHQHQTNIDIRQALERVEERQRHQHQTNIDIRQALRILIERQEHQLTNNGIKEELAGLEANLNIRHEANSQKIDSTKSLVKSLDRKIDPQGWKKHIDDGIKVATAMNCVLPLLDSVKTLSLTRHSMRHLRVFLLIFYILFGLSGMFPRIQALSVLTMLFAGIILGFYMMFKK